MEVEIVRMSDLSEVEVAIISAIVELYTTIQTQKSTSEMKIETGPKWNLRHGWCRIKSWGYMGRKELMGL